MPGGYRVCEDFIPQFVDCAENFKVGEGGAKRLPHPGILWIFQKVGERGAQISIWIGLDKIGADFWVRGSGATGAGIWPGGQRTQAEMLQTGCDPWGSIVGS